jgi:hypothetical protein
MPDAQGYSSFIGNFVNGFMQQTQKAEEEKMAKVSNLMQLAEKYRQHAEDPLISNEEYNGWQLNLTQTMEEADKLMKQSSSMWGPVVKIFGFGKGKKNPPIPRELFMKSGGEGQLQEPQAAPAGVTNAMPQGASGFVDPYQNQNLSWDQRVQLMKQNPLVMYATGDGSLPNPIPGVTTLLPGAPGFPPGSLPLPTGWESRGVPLSQANPLAARYPSTLTPDPYTGRLGPGAFSVQPGPVAPMVPGVTSAMPPAEAPVSEGQKNFTDWYRSRQPQGPGGLSPVIAKYAEGERRPESPTESPAGSFAMPRVEDILGGKTIVQFAKDYNVSPRWVQQMVLNQIAGRSGNQFEMAKETQRLTLQQKFARENDKYKSAQEIAKLENEANTFLRIANDQGMDKESINQGYLKIRFGISSPTTSASIVESEEKDENGNDITVIRNRQTGQPLWSRPSAPTAAEKKFEQDIDDYILDAKSKGKIITRDQARSQLATANVNARAALVQNRERAGELQKLNIDYNKVRNQLQNEKTPAGEGITPEEAEKALNHARMLLNTKLGDDPVWQYSPTFEQEKDAYLLQQARLYLSQKKELITPKTPEEEMRGYNPGGRGSGPAPGKILNKP